MNFIKQFVDNEHYGCGLNKSAVAILNLVIFVGKDFSTIKSSCVQEDNKLQKANDNNKCFIRFCFLLIYNSVTIS